MPVRIYDIAKRLGVESKVVIKTAKELGITHARVASSTIDKITAEYLEEKLHELGYGQPAPAPAVEQKTAPEPQQAAPAAVEAAPTAVAVEPPPAELVAAPAVPETAQPAPSVAEVPTAQAPKPVEVSPQPAPPKEIEAPTAVQPAPPEISPEPRPVTCVPSTEIVPAPVSEAVLPAPPAATTPTPEISVALETPVTQQRAGEPTPVLPVAEPGEKIKGEEAIQPQVQVSAEPGAPGKPAAHETAPQPARTEPVAARIAQPVSEPNAQAPATAAAMPASLPAAPAPQSPPS
ncbi:MAG: translation initiation factor IF-2 N-terminal domain-containing protein, partial [Verrucomicrobiia bacterium]